MNQRRVRVLPRIVPQAYRGLRRSRRGEYAAKPHLPGLGKTGITDLNSQSSFMVKPTIT